MYRCSNNVRGWVVSKLLKRSAVCVAVVRALVSSRLREKGVEEFRTLGLELAGTRFISLPHRFGATMLWGAAERQNAGAPREGWLEYQRLGFEHGDPLFDVPVNEFSYVPAFIHPPFHHLSSWEHCLSSLSFRPTLLSFIGLFLVSRYNSLACSLFCVEKLQGEGGGVKTALRSLE